MAPYSSIVPSTSQFKGADAKSSGSDKTEELISLFRAERDRTVQLISALSPEDMILQSMPDASPAKWHLAHTAWFFEEFLLSSHLPDYRWHDPSFRYLFNSYYETVGERQPRPHRGMLSRPMLETILQYRALIDERVCSYLRNNQEAADIVVLGIHHEMQHQELLLTDILHAFSFNPSLPAVFTAISRNGRHQQRATVPLAFQFFERGLCEVGAGTEGFAFDCERTRHKFFLNPFAIANRAVTNGEWMQFMDDSGYETPSLWLSDGWACKSRNGWEAPLYWRKKEGWQQFGLHGLQPLDMASPVCHVSYYEADAYARWAGCRLPTEQEWEHVASLYAIEGNFLGQADYCPRPAPEGSGIKQLYGDIWEWTQSAFAAYPGFKPRAGAIGEYNGKFMSGQFVLRGGSCVTNALQMRPSYRNFFYPHQRWQFSGLRLAKDG